MVSQPKTRYDLKEHHALVLGSARTLIFSVVDDDGSPIDSFAGYELEFFVIDSLHSNPGLDNLRNNSAVYITNENIVKDTPYAQIDIGADDWPETIGMWYYTLWRVDGNNPRPLAFGEYPVIH